MFLVRYRMHGMRSAYTIVEGPRLQLRNRNSKITQGLQPPPTLLLHFVVHRPTNKNCSICTLCTTKVYTARDDICAGNRQLHIKAQSNCTRAHPSIPRPPQPCLGVKFKTTVRCSPLRTKTLISFCKHDEHEFGATLPPRPGPEAQSTHVLVLGDHLCQGLQRRSGREGRVPQVPEFDDEVVALETLHTTPDIRSAVSRKRRGG